LRPVSRATVFDRAAWTPGLSFNVRSLDAFELAEFFLIVGCPVQVQRELAVEPELGRGAERPGQPQGR